MTAPEVTAPEVAAPTRSKLRSAMPTDPPSGRDDLRIACVQFAPAAEADESRALAAELIQQASTDGAGLVVLPELFTGPYFCQTEDHAAFDRAEPLDGPTVAALSQAAKTAQAVVVGSIFERRAAGLHHNTAVVLDADGSLAGYYRKLHIPDDPLYAEKFYFTPGDATGGRADHPGVFDTAAGRVGVIVCWDQWFPEAARLAALHGAETLCIPTAIGWHPSERAEFGDAQLDAWITIQRSHAIANGCTVAVANRIGHEPTPAAAGEGIDFWGQSFIAGPDGSIRARGGSDAAAIVTAAIGPDESATQRTHWPFLRDRRVDAYAGLTQRWLAD